MSTDSNISWQETPSCVRLTLARAEKLNPLDWVTVRELKDAVAKIEGMPVVAVVITGHGRSFSAGGDLEGYLRLYRRPDEFSAFLDDFFQMLNAIEASSKIYVAAINGVCVAGGLELLLACDLVIAAASARIGDGHLNFGPLPGAGGSQRLPRAIGLLRAKHLILTGNEKRRVGLRGAKHLTNLTLTTDLATGLKREIEFVHRYATTEPDATEGLVAFKEKRNPVFSR